MFRLEIGSYSRRDRFAGRGPERVSVRMTLDPPGPEVYTETRVIMRIRPTRTAPARSNVILMDTCTCATRPARRTQIRFPIADDADALSRSMS